MILLGLWMIVVVMSAVKWQRRQARSAAAMPCEDRVYRRQSLCRNLACARIYIEAMTPVSSELILLDSRPRVTTTAIVITPRTTAYSAIVWPASSRSVSR